MQGLFYQEHKWCRKNCLGLIWVAANIQLGSAHAAFSARACDMLGLHGLFINGDSALIEGLRLGGWSQWCNFKRHLANNNIHVQYDKKIKPFWTLSSSQPHLRTASFPLLFIHIQCRARLYHLKTCRIMCSCA